MQVFKSYFKILNRHMGQMIMYLSIFIGVMVVLTATRTNKAEGDYEAIKPKFAVFDYDNSSESRNDPGSDEGQYAAYHWRQ